MALLEDARHRDLAAEDHFLHGLAHLIEEDGVEEGLKKAAEIVSTLRQADPEELTQ